MDVRPKIQFSICSLPNSLHIPIEELESKMDIVKDEMEQKKISDKDGKK